MWYYYCRYYYYYYHHYYINENVLVTVLDVYKYSPVNVAGLMTRTRRDPERNVPPGIPEFSPVRFASGSPPLLGSWMITAPLSLYFPLTLLQQKL
jgi:hypothetical protein